MSGSLARPGVVREALLRLATQAPDHIACTAAETGESLTHEELLRRAGAIAATVRDLGNGDEVDPASPVIACLENGPMLTAVFAASILGDFPIALLGPATSDAEIADAAARLNARLLISRRATPALHNIDPWSIPPLPTAAEAIRAATRLTNARSASAWAVILHTSGTTARPKLVLREAPALDAVAVNTARAVALTDRDQVLAAIPMAHSYGLEHALLAPLLTGATVVTMAAFDAARAASLLHSRITVFPGVPVMFEALAAPALAPRSDQRRPRLTYSAGAPLPAATRARFEEAWRIPIGNLYGSTDVGSVVFNDPASPHFHPEFAGHPMPGVSIRILSDSSPEATVLPTGESGHVAIRAPSMLTRYIDGPPRRLADGHLLTGDLGLLDPVRGLRLTGREALLLDIDGRKVNPAEIESALAEHPGVAAAVVTAIPITPTINRLRAVIEPRDPHAPPAAAQLRAALRARLAPYKIPRLFEFVDRLPRSESGKILRTLPPDPVPSGAQRP